MKASNGSKKRNGEGYEWTRPAESTGLIFRRSTELTGGNDACLVALRDMLLLRALARNTVGDRPVESGGGLQNARAEGADCLDWKILPLRILHSQFIEQRMVVSGLSRRSAYDFGRTNHEPHIETSCTASLPSSLVKIRYREAAGARQAAPTRCPDQKTALSGHARLPSRLFRVLERTKARPRRSTRSCRVYAAHPQAFHVPCAPFRVATPSRHA